MKPISIISRLSPFITCAFFLLFFTQSAHSTAITLIANDPSGQSSFTSGDRWSDGLAPSSGKDYEIPSSSTTSSLTIRTPASSGNYTFAGNSLTLNYNAHLAYKGTGASDSITIPSLYMNNLSYINNYSSGTFTLNGNIILSSGNAYFQFSPTNGGFNITASISGSGKLNFSSNSSMTSLASSACTLYASNTYSGGTTIGSYAYVIAASSGAFGTGNVTVNGGLLVLQTSAAIDDNARLILTSGLTATSVAMYFNDTMTISGLSFDGGSTYIGSGTYSITELNSLYGQNIFVGDGVTDGAVIQVIPEPRIFTILLLGCLICFATALRKEHLNAVLRGFDSA